MKSALGVYNGISGYRYETLAEDAISIHNIVQEKISIIKPELLQKNCKIC